MSVKRTALAAAFFLALLTLPTTTRFGLDLSFTNGGDDGGHGDGHDAGRAGSGTGGAGGAGGTGGDSAGVGGAGAGSSTTVPTTITASPVVVSKLGMRCRTIIQTIEIDGRIVHASAKLCREPNGRWQIAPTQSARVGKPRSTPTEVSSLPP